MARGKVKGGTKTGNVKVKIKVTKGRRTVKGVLIGDFDMDGILDRIVFFKRVKGRGIAGNVSLSSLMKRRPKIKE